jgi:hypothetical protein
VIIPAIASRCEYAVDEDCFYSNDKTSICIADDPPFIVAMLNSSVGEWFIRKTAAQRQGGFLEFKPMYIAQLPIVAASEADKAKLSELATACQEAAKANDNARLQTLEAEIDQIVYRLFDLTPAEIALIEKSVPRT